MVVCTVIIWGPSVCGIPHSSLQVTSSPFFTCSVSQEAPGWVQPWGGTSGRAMAGVGTGEWRHSICSPAPSPLSHCGLVLGLLGSLLHHSSQGSNSFLALASSRVLHCLGFVPFTLTPFDYSIWVFCLLVETEYRWSISYKTNKTLPFSYQNCINVFFHSLIRFWVHVPHF